MTSAREIEVLPLRDWHAAPVRLRRGEVHVILTRLPSTESRRGAPAVLDAEERRRRDRFAFAADRHRFAWSHAVLRAVLGRYLGRPAAAVQLPNRTARRARPTLIPGARLRLGYSLSHSGDFAAVAVVREAQVGVDLEVPRRQLDCMGVARAHFAETEIAFLETIPRYMLATEFLRVWTAKEAVLKAIGTGLTRPLSNVELRLRQGRPAEIRTIADAPPLAIWFPLRADVSAAVVAVASPRFTSRCRLWAGDAEFLTPAI